MSLYAVLGHPIDHSLSPRIHEAFGVLTGRVVRYERREVHPGGLAHALRTFASEGGRGANITVPLKGEAFALAARTTARAQRARAVNTLSWEGEAWAGDNTDGAGLVCDLTVNYGWPLEGRRIVLLGAGGAAQGIIGPLLDQGIAHLAIFNRTLERARNVAESCADARVGVIGSGTGSDTPPFDIVINATAAGLAGSLPMIPGIPDAFFHDVIAYDLMYGPKARDFLGYARAHGARAVADGLGMLVEQAAESFQVWHGVRPPTAPVLTRLRSEIGGG
ncbi:shikimate dehydrogenase [Acidiferrobacter sp.]|uniref:shikimate dehydrogenase n=1 Tax=Acidiferrobacter sp. TaxID=1872107 RepID=UPI0026269275|nr:shikimate dehydrogenase [Acidiferrobacter sp.]